MQALLSVEQAPPVQAPLRFLLTAPLFLVLAGLVLIVAGGDVFASRWMPASLAVTHLVTVGFMLLTMLGALVQILPVVAGAHLARPSALAAAVHGLVSGGTLLLAAAFLFGGGGLFVAAALLLGAGAGLFIIAAGKSLFAIPPTSPTIVGIKISLFGAAGVVALGIALALALGAGWGWPLIELTNLHATWGFAAWAGTLLAAIAYVVVPMFQLTPAYRARFSKWLAPALIVGAVVAALAMLVGSPLLSRLAEGILAAAGGAFALVTLSLQRQRRRARLDTPSMYWQGGLLAALAALAMLLIGAIWPDLAAASAWPLLFGILLGLGGFVSLIAGMLYRIVPFLLWLHLQQQGVLSHVGKILPDAPMRGQMMAHAGAVALCVAAVFAPESFSRPAGLMLLLSGVWLELNLLQAVRHYRDQAKSA